VHSSRVDDALPRSYRRNAHAITLRRLFKARRLTEIVSACQTAQLRRLFLGGVAPLLPNWPAPNWWARALRTLPTPKWRTRDSPQSDLKP